MIRKSMCGLAVLAYISLLVACGGGSETGSSSGGSSAAQSAGSIASSDGSPSNSSEGESSTEQQSSPGTQSSSGQELSSALPASSEAADSSSSAAQTSSTAECHVRDEPGSSPAALARVNACGFLTYQPYANRGQEQARNWLPDFSHAGYAGGGVALPEVPVAMELSPEAGEGDDLARIQQALDNLGAMTPNALGFRGALLLRKGTYHLSDTLRIRHSGVVLRGEGQGGDGTVLIATRQAPHAVIDIQPEANAGLAEAAGTRTRITSAYVGVGERSFEVASAAAFRVGDVIGVERTPNQNWVDQLQMSQWGWTPASYTIAHERVITAVDGKRISVDIPLVDTLEDAYGGGAVFLARADRLANRLQKVGVEDLRLVAKHTDPEAEQHANIGVRLGHTFNSWVQRVSAVHFSYATISVEQNSNFNTFQEVAYLEPASLVTGSRRYAFNVSSGLGNLFQRCYAESGRHSFVSGGRVTGPNVWLDCIAVRASNDDGPHHRWATGLLFDNIKSRRINVQNRKDSGTGHGWAGAQVMIWNSQASEGFIVDAPLGAMNWIVGGVGAQNEGSWAPEEPPGWWESHGTPAQPRSLYLQQLQDRLGSAAVLATTTSHQRDGRIWDQLQGWAGEGLLRNAEPVEVVDGECTGISTGQACCPASCGQCGGTGCSQFPGGASQCCTGNILESGLSCVDYQPPCIIP